MGWWDARLGTVRQAWRLLAPNGLPGSEPERISDWVEGGNGSTALLRFREATLEMVMFGRFLNGPVPDRGPTRLKKLRSPAILRFWACSAAGEGV